MAAKIYTKTGDNGTTALIGGAKVSKAHLRIEAYGNVDELNSYIGLCRDLQTDHHIVDHLRHVQESLFVIGALLATDPHKNIKMELPVLKEEEVIFLEKEMDSMNTILPPLKFFTLPGGSVAVSHLHIARCVCRRAERSCVRLPEIGEPVNPSIIKYLNRLSDYLFVLARYTAHNHHIPEIPWHPDK